MSSSAPLRHYAPVRRSARLRRAHGTAVIAAALFAGASCATSASPPQATTGTTGTASARATAPQPAPIPAARVAQ